MSATPFEDRSFAQFEMRPCVCGDPILADPLNPISVLSAVVTHSKSTRHEDWQSRLAPDIRSAGPVPDASLGPDEG